MLLGNADSIVQHLCNRLGWTLPGSDSRKRPAEAPDPMRVGDRCVRYPHVKIIGLSACSHVWLFEGAEGGRYVKQLQEGIQVSPTQQQPWKRLRVI